jgi:hypothetical protein
MTQQRLVEKQVELYRNLIRHEAQIGGQLFGAIPQGVRREFFCLDKNTWVWHEEWVDQEGKRHIVTTRYDVRPDGILKSQNGHYQKVSYQEALRLQEAAHMYQQRIGQEIYSFAR